MLQTRVFDRVTVSIKVDEGNGNGGDRKLVIGLVHQDRDLAEVIRSRPRKAAVAEESAPPQKMPSSDPGSGRVKKSTPKK